MEHLGRGAGSGGVRLDASEFAARYQAAAPTLWCIAAAIVPNRAMVEDVLQEAAMVAIEKLGQFDPETNFTAWMGQVVRYVGLNQARRTVRRRATAVDPVVLNHTTESRRRDRGGAVTGRGELAVDQEAFDDRVQAALMTLEETARACLLLKTVLELSYKEIATALSLPEGTAMSHVHRARRAMREQLQTHHEETSASRTDD